MLKKLNVYKDFINYNILWEIGLRQKKETGNFCFDRNIEGFKIAWNMPEDTWAADPFLINEKGRTYLFFELYDCIKEKGCIAFREIINEDDLGPVQVVVDEKFHLSFPYIFKINEQIYMIPESSSANKILLYKAIEFPNKWALEKMLLDNVKAVDSIILQYGNLRGILTSIENGGSCVLQNHFYILNDQLDIINDRVVSSIGSYGIRNAGKILQFNGDTYRVAQDCSNGEYGKGLVLFKINKITENELSEAVIHYIQGNVKIANNEYVGVHTYNSTKDYEVIDLKIVKENTLFVKTKRILFILYRCIKRRLF